VIRRRLFWTIFTIGLLVVTILLVRQHFVLDSEKLEYDISNELPLGSSKAQVVAFIERRRPLFCDDLGSQIKARLSGRAGNMIYGKDVILIFEFDSGGKLISHSMKVYLSFV
jgi:hypothetical protein